MPALLMCRYHSSRVSSCQICFDRSCRPERSSSIRVVRASERIKPVPTSSPPTRTSSISSRRSRATQALRGAEKEAFGRLIISSGSQAWAACFRATLPLRPDTLRSPAREKAALKTTGSTNGTRTSVGRGHARPVSVREVEARQEHPGVRQAHAVDVVRKEVIAIDLEMLSQYVAHVGLEFGANQCRQLEGVIKAVAATEGGFLRQLSEGEEPLGPPGVTKTFPPTATGMWVTADAAAWRANRGSRR